MLNRRILFFIAVVEEGSFAKAAKRLFISQSAISQQVHLLEKEIGLKLLDRSGYRARLTDAGNFYYKSCKQMFDDYEKVIEKAKRMASQSAKILTIGITGPFEKKHLPIVIKRFKKIEEDVNVYLKKISFQTGPQRVSEGQLDMTFGIRNDMVDYRNLQSIILFEHKVCVICSKDHPWANRQYVNSEELANQSIVTFSKKIGSRFYDDFFESFRKDGICPKIVQEVEELEEMLMAIKINQGIGLLSREVILEEDEVCMLDIHKTHHHAEFCLGYGDKNEKKYVKTFAEVAKTYFKDFYPKDHKKN